MTVTKIITTPDPLGGVKCQYLNSAIIKLVVNIFTANLHADRGKIDMNHINWDFSSKALIRFHSKHIISDCISMRRISGP